MFKFNFSTIFKRGEKFVLIVSLAVRTKNVDSICPTQCKSLDVTALGNNDKS